MSDPASPERSREAATAPQALTHTQQQIWLGQRLNPASPLYNMAFAFVFPTELRADLFCEAWQRVADASDALRTRIVDDGRDDARWTLSRDGGRNPVWVRGHATRACAVGAQTLAKPPCFGGHRQLPLERGPHGVQHRLAAAISR